MEYSWLLPEGYRSLVAGTEITVAASGLAMLPAIGLGLVAAVAEQAGNRVVRAVVAIYVSFIRGTPLFVQILVVYFILPAVGIDIPAFAAGVVALSANSGAYVSQMVIGALTAIPGGQLEAARALALPEMTIWRRILIPQTLRLMVPPLTLEAAALVKNSALLAIIGVVELTRTAQEIVSSTYNPTPTWLVVAAIYFVLCFAIGLAARRMERATSAQSFR